MIRVLPSTASLQFPFPFPFFPSHPALPLTRTPRPTLMPQHSHFLHPLIMLLRGSVSQGNFKPGPMDVGVGCCLARSRLTKPSSTKVESGKHPPIISNNKFTFDVTGKQGEFKLRQSCSSGRGRARIQSAILQKFKVYKPLNQIHTLILSSTMRFIQLFVFISIFVGRHA